MVEISLSGSEGAPGGQLPGATREVSISAESWIVHSSAAGGNEWIDGPSTTANTSWTCPAVVLLFYQREKLLRRDYRDSVGASLLGFAGS
jgi:hypothetical protein